MVGLILVVLVIAILLILLCYALILSGSWLINKKEENKKLGAVLKVLGCILLVGSTLIVPLLIGAPVFMLGLVIIESVLALGVFAIFKGRKQQVKQNNKKAGAVLRSIGYIIIIPITVLSLFVISIVLFL